jgi:hypothetical protein
MKYVRQEKKRNNKNFINVNAIQETDKVFFPEVEEFYMYSPTSQYASGSFSSGGAQKQIKIAKDSITYVTSGLVDRNKGTILSYLHKSIKALNQLRMIEDSLVIYRLSRAPERRIFYIDVGNLPKVKAEQYLKEVMSRYRNKLVYDASTGEVRDDKKFMSMMEDFWLPRREGGRGTEITTLPGGQNLGELSDIEYFQKKLFQSLNVPVSRLNQENVGILGRASEISRDEAKFTKFCGRLRRRFSHLLMKALEKQLILKGVVSEDDFKELKNQITFDFTVDNHFEEFKNTEIIQNRLNILDRMMPYIGRYYSDMWVRKNLLMQKENEIADMMDEMSGEKIPILPPSIDGQETPPPIANRPTAAIVTSMPSRSSGCPKVNLA